MGRPNGAGPQWTGLGGYGPVPDNDKLASDQNPSPHYEDGWMNRAPLGCHVEGPADIWIDAITYPERMYAASDAEADAMDLRGRNFTLSTGQVLGTKPGPRE